MTGSKAEVSAIATRQTHVVAPAAEPALEAVPRAPVLITEQEVLFATAAAMPPGPTTVRWWSNATAAVQAAARRIFAPSVQDDRPVHRDYPRRYAYLERACMAREMDRL